MNGDHSWQALKANDEPSEKAHGMTTSGNTHKNRIYGNVKAEPPDSSEGVSKEKETNPNKMWRKSVLSKYPQRALRFGYRFGGFIFLALPIWPLGDFFC